MTDKPIKPSDDYELRNYDFAEDDESILVMSEDEIKGGRNNKGEVETALGRIVDAHKWNFWENYLHKQISYNREMVDYLDANGGGGNNPEFPQVVISFNDSETTTNDIFTISGDLITNKINAGLKFTIKHNSENLVFLLTEDVDLGPLDSNRLYYLIIEITNDLGDIDKVSGVYQLTANDLSIIPSNSIQEWGVRPTRTEYKANFAEPTNYSSPSGEQVWATHEPIGEAYPAWCGFRSGSGDQYRISISEVISEESPLLLLRAMTIDEDIHRLYYVGDATDLQVISTTEDLSGYSNITTDLRDITYTVHKTVEGKSYADYEIELDTPITPDATALGIRVTNTDSITTDTIIIAVQAIFETKHDCIVINNKTELCVVDGEIQDKYNKELTIDGDISLDGNIATFDGFESIIVPMPSLMDKKWVYQTKKKFETDDEYLEVITAMNDMGLTQIYLYKNEENLLVLSLASSLDVGLNYDIASDVSGSKSDWDTLTWYYIRLKFTGSAYLVEWSLDGETWTTDIEVESSTSVHNNDDMAMNIVGAYVGSNFMGALDISEEKITVGNDKLDDYGVMAYDRSNTYLGYPDDYVSENARKLIMVGSIETDNSSIATAIPFDFNRRLIKTGIGVPTDGDIKQYLCENSLGFKVNPNYIKLSAICNYVDSSYSFGEECVVAFTYVGVNTFMVTEEGIYADYDELYKYNPDMGDLTQLSDEYWDLKVEIIGGNL